MRNSGSGTIGAPPGSRLTIGTHSTMLGNRGSLQLVHLTRLMGLTRGKPEVAIGLIDGPIAMHHRDLSGAHIREIPGRLSGTCSRATSVACTHGTFVAGILSAQSGSVAPAICPRCTLLLRPIFSEAPLHTRHATMPTASPTALAEAIIDTAQAGARVINLSSGLVQSSQRDDCRLQQALDYAAGRGVITVAAAGNQGTVGTSVLSRHPSVIPVAAFNIQGRPLSESNLGGSIGRRGLGAAGEHVTSLRPDGKAQIFSGTSAAAPFVTGAIALLWSEFPGATAAQITFAVTQCGPRPRRTIAPPLLNAWAAYQLMVSP
jgi:subtilisin family serine protease